jgi:hypothetical protein
MSFSRKVAAVAPDAVNTTSIVPGQQGKRGRGRSSHRNLHAMVAAVGHDDAAVAVNGNAAVGAAELPVA